MKTLDYKAFFWEEFDEDKKPINPKECQITFNPKDGGQFIYFLNTNEELDYENFENNNIKILYGHLLGGKQFTLKYLNFESAKLDLVSNIELTEVTYSIKFIFYGGWVDQDKKIKIMNVRYSYLELWFNKLEIKKHYEDREKIVNGIMIHKEFLGGSSAEYDVLFNIENGLSRNSFNNRLVTYEATNSLTITKKDAFGIDEAMALASVIKDFFVVMTFYSKNKIFIEKINIWEEIKLESSSECNEPIDLLFKQEDYLEEQKMSHMDFLLKYEDIKGNFVQVLNNWIENHDKNKNEYSAFCNVISDKNIKFNIYTHYFQLISALEGYHRNNNKDQEIEIKEKYDKYKIELKEQLNNTDISPQDRNKLLKRLLNPYQMTLEERLLELVNKSDIKILLKLDDEIHTLILNFAKNMRNTIGHLKESLEIDNKIQSSFEYLKVVALLLMMKDISLNHTQISKNILDYDLNSIKKDLENSFL